jgi:hypothetical protein
MKEKEKSGGRGLGVLGVLLDYALAQIAPGPGVRRLVDALGSRDEDTATAAYMFLVKLGPRIAARLVEEARKGHETVSVLQILGDQGDGGVVADLEGFAESPDREVASAARESLESLLGQGAEE